MQTQALDHVTPMPRPGVAHAAPMPCPYQIETSMTYETLVEVDAERPSCVTPAFEHPVIEQIILRLHPMLLCGLIWDIHGNWAWNEYWFATHRCAD